MSGTLMLFPVCNKAAIQTTHCTEDLYLLIRERIVAQGTVRVIGYDPKNVSVERMIREQRLDEKAATGDFPTDATGQATALKIAKETGVQLAVLSCIDRYQFDAEKRRLEVTGTLLLLDVASEKVKKQVTGNVTINGGEKGGGTEEALAIQAMGDLVAKFFSAGGGIEKSDLMTGAQDEVISSEQKTRKDKNILPAMLAAVLIGILLGGG